MLILNCTDFSDTVHSQYIMSSVVYSIIMLVSLLFFYADDILMLAPSVTVGGVGLLQKFLWSCEHQELDSIDMSINVKKSSCMTVDLVHVMRSCEPKYDS